MNEYGVTQEDWDRVLTRDKDKCWCGASADTVDHVIPRSRDGKHDPTNLAANCRDHNCGANATPPTTEYQTGIKIRQETFEHDCQLIIDAAWHIVKEWPGRPRETAIKRALNQYPRWLSPGLIVRLVKQINSAPDHSANPPWQQLIGLLNNHKQAVLNKRGRSMSGAPIEGWNQTDERDYLIAENGAMKRRITQLEQRQLQLEKYLLGEGQDDAT